MRPQLSGGRERGRPLTRKWAGRAAPVRPVVGGVSGRGPLGVVGPPTVSLLRSGGCLSRW